MSFENLAKGQGIEAELFHKDQRYELFTTVATSAASKTPLEDELNATRQRHPGQQFIATRPSKLTLSRQPNCAGHIYIQSDHERIKPFRSAPDQEE